jgi:two-component system response regulator NreC
VSEKIRVLIADDHTIVRAGVRLLLDAEPDIEVVGEAVNGNEAMRLTESLKPEVVLMDIAMPDTAGADRASLGRVFLRDAQGRGVWICTERSGDE